MVNDDNKNDLRDAKSATSTYASDPSDRNAAKAQFTLGTVKDLKPTMWRQHFEKWLRLK